MLDPSAPAPPAALELRRCGYSVNPWRIGVVVADGTFREIAHAHFRLKRDAVPVLHALQALGAPWDTPVADWPPDLLAQAQAIVHATEAYAHWQATATRGRSPH